MLFPNNIEEKLGFDKIRDQLKKHCVSKLGLGFLEKMKFSSNSDLIVRLCAQTEEMIRAIRSGENLPALSHLDAQRHLHKARVIGAFMEPDELYEVGISIQTTYSWINFLDQRKDDFTEICALSKSLHIDHKMALRIFEKISERGEIKDNASHELHEIRSEIQSQSIKARKTLEKLIAKTTSEGQTPDDASLTVRNGRLVIPVKAEFKRTFKGFIHDESATGSIAYIEPAEVLEINNTIKDLEYQQRREIIRILTNLTDMIRPELPNLDFAYQFLGKIDFIRCKALFALEFDAIFPILNKQKKFDWHQAIHPILKYSLEKQQKKIVPLDIRIDEENRVMVISGPNAGGKSVCLKTVGLLQYMLQCGMPIPVSEGSSAYIIDDLFIDIGDEQSIENDLSTYSSHLKNMDYFRRYANKNTLFLIDEFGSGTDPQFGGAIAQALMERLVKSKAMGIVTTHFSNLKKMAESTLGMVNARMRFDVRHLQPLYQLEIGRPGSSFSLEIAGKIGLPEEVLKSARSKIGVDEIQLDKLLNELELEKKSYEEKKKDYDQKNELLNKTLNHYTSLKEDIEDNRKTILNEAKHEAKNLIREANQKIEHLIREIRENKAEKTMTKQIREELKSYDSHLKPEKITKKPEIEEVTVVQGKINTGDFVRLKDQGNIGEVLQTGKMDATVLFGDLKSKVKLNRLEKVSKKSFKNQQNEPSVTNKIKGLDINQRKSEFTSELDIRGKRADEAIAILTNFIDDAIMFAMPLVRIIHGKGDGILRDIVRNELKDYKAVKTFYDEHADRGGSGITIVEFN